MSRRETKTITVIVPGKGLAVPVTVTAVTAFTDLLCVADCPDWYVVSLTRDGPTISLTNKRLLDVVQHKGKLYLSSPVQMTQMDLPIHGNQTMDRECTVHK